MLADALFRYATEGGYSKKFCADLREVVDNFEYDPEEMGKAPLVESVLSRYRLWIEKDRGLDPWVKEIFEKR